MAAGAEQQGRLWPFVEAFYAAQGQENSGYVSDGFLRSVSKAAGVDAGTALRAAGGEFALRRLERGRRRRHAALRRRDADVHGSTRAALRS